MKHLKIFENFDTDTELKAVTDLYNGILNDRSIQRFTMQWKDVTTRIKKLYKGIKLDKDVQFQNSLLTRAAEQTNDQKLKDIIKTFGRELNINIETLNSKSDPRKR